MAWGFDRTERSDNTERMMRLARINSATQSLDPTLFDDDFLNKCRELQLLAEKQIIELMKK
jgi:hypothetical protein